MRRIIAAAGVVPDAAPEIFRFGADLAARAIIGT
jgi:hypothetical protein